MYSNKNIIIASSVASLISVGFYLNNNENPLYSYSLINHEFSFDDRYKKANRIIKQYKELYGIPAVIVSVSHNGKTVYSKAVGYSDVENNVKATTDTVMRIASISKPITCLIAAKLFENGKLDLDKPIDEYLTDLPKFFVNDKEVKITTRQLMSHTSGIRHYKKNNDNNNDNNCQGKDTDFPEFYLNKKFSSTKKALELFINDELIFEPGTSYLYTSFGYTLLSAILEKVSNDAPFSKLLEETFKNLGLSQTYLDKNDPIIPNRSKYYMRNDKSKLQNVPYVDNSYKWAGGGLLSNVNDLIKLGNSMLYFYQIDDNTTKFLKQSTIKSQIWSPQSFPNKNGNNILSEPNELTSYGLGWVLVSDELKNLKFAYHTGGAVGASSCLMVIPDLENSDDKAPKGTVIAVLCNSQDVSEIVSLTQNIARIFSK